MHEQHVQVFLFDRPCLGAGARRGQRHRLAIAGELARTQINLVQLDPLRGNPAFVLEHAQLRIGAMEMHQAHEEQRQDRFPARVRRLRQGGFKRRLIRERKFLAHLP